MATTRTRFGLFGLLVVAVFIVAALLSGGSGDAQEAGELLSAASLGLTVTDSFETRVVNASIAYLAESDVDVVALLAEEAEDLEVGAEALEEAPTVEELAKEGVVINGFHGPIAGTAREGNISVVILSKKAGNGRCLHFLQLREQIPLNQSLGDLLSSFIFWGRNLDQSDGDNNCSHQFEGDFIARLLQAHKGKFPLGFNKSYFWVITELAAKIFGVK